MIPNGTRVFVCAKPVDMRSSFDRLALLALESLGEDVRAGAVCCFINKSGTHCKVLWWDKTGLCILYKRGDRVRFVSPRHASRDASCGITVDELVELLAGVGVQLKKSSTKVNMRLDA